MSLRCREDLQSAGNGKETQGWLRGSLQTSTGTRQLYSALQHYVQQPMFLQKLTAARVAQSSAHSSLPTAPHPEEEPTAALLVDSTVLQSWQCEDDPAHFEASV